MKQILIIDDDISINDMLDKVLARAGYETFHAWSGTEALLFLKDCGERKPDLILLDLMPVSYTHLKPTSCRKACCTLPPCSRP